MRTCAQSSRRPASDVRPTTTHAAAPRAPQMLLINPRMTPIMHPSCMCPPTHKLLMTDDPTSPLPLQAAFTLPHIAPTNDAAPLMPPLCSQ
eukprot:3039609-Pyramimonas_sp.AAC.1